jgi:hypothetical protein
MLLSSKWSVLARLADSKPFLSMIGLTMLACAHSKDNGPNPASPDGTGAVAPSETVMEAQPEQAIITKEMHDELAPAWAGDEKKYYLPDAWYGHGEDHTGDVAEAGAPLVCQVWTKNTEDEWDGSSNDIKLYMTFGDTTIRVVGPTNKNSFGFALPWLRPNLGQNVEISVWDTDPWIDDLFGTFVKSFDGHFPLEFDGPEASVKCYYPSKSEIAKNLAPILLELDEKLSELEHAWVESTSKDCRFCSGNADEISRGVRQPFRKAAALVSWADHRITSRMNQIAALELREEELLVREFTRSAKKTETDMVIDVEGRSIQLGVERIECISGVPQIHVGLRNEIGTPVEIWSSAGYIGYNSGNGYIQRFRVATIEKTIWLTIDSFITPRQRRTNEIVTIKDGEAAVFVLIPQKGSDAVACEDLANRFLLMFENEQQTRMLRLGNYEAIIARGEALGANEPEPDPPPKPDPEPDKEQTQPASARIHVPPVKTKREIRREIRREKHADWVQYPLIFDGRYGDIWSPRRAIVQFPFHLIGGAGYVFGTTSLGSGRSRFNHGYSTLVGVRLFNVVRLAALWDGSVSGSRIQYALDEATNVPVTMYSVNAVIGLNAPVVWPWMNIGIDFALGSGDLYGLTGMGNSDLSMSGLFNFGVAPRIGLFQDIIGVGYQYSRMSVTKGTNLEVPEGVGINSNLGAVSASSHQVVLFFNIAPILLDFPIAKLQQWFHTP